MKNWPKMLILNAVVGYVARGVFITIESSNRMAVSGSKPQGSEYPVRQSIEPRLKMFRLRQEQKCKTNHKGQRILIFRNVDGRMADFPAL